MHLRLFFLLLLLASALVTPVALGAPRDKAANDKIDQAINQHYLATEFDQAESLLLGTVQACGDKCSNSVKAKAWMYVGVVRGSGKEDQAGALEAFQQAVALDPNVRLDEALATPATKQTFLQVSPAGGAQPLPAVPGVPGVPGAGPAPGAAPTEGLPPTGAPPPGGAAAMLCTPLVHEVETRRHVPISCSTQATTGGGRIFYQEVNNPEWKSVSMTRQGSVLQGTVPCGATGLVGKLNLYVEARNPQGVVVEAMGSRTAPVEFTLVEKSAQPPPSLPGQAAPPRCEEDVCANAPPDFPGCEKRGNKVWGDSCAANEECQSALCKAGTCDSCEKDDDCSSGKCTDGSCSVAGGGGPGGKKQRKLWVGVHFAGDIALVGGKDVCTAQVQADKGYVCYYAGTNTRYPYRPFPGQYDEISTGFVYATSRVLASFDYQLVPKLSLGVRVGFAFGGGPPAANGTAFLPLHAEARAAYWFTPRGKPGFRPYVHLGGGLAQIDSKNQVGALDCAGKFSPTTLKYTTKNTNENYQACYQGTNRAVASGVNLDVYRKMGQAFGTAGGGLEYGVTERFGIQLNVNLMVMLPTIGFALEPSLGGVFGF